MKCDRHFKTKTAPIWTHCDVLGLNGFQGRAESTDFFAVKTNTECGIPFEGCVLVTKCVNLGFDSQILLGTNPLMRRAVVCPEVNCCPCFPMSTHRTIFLPSFLQVNRFGALMHLETFYLRRKSFMPFNCSDIIRSYKLHSHIFVEQVCPKLYSTSSPSRMFTTRNLVITIREPESTFASEGKVYIRLNWLSTFDVPMLWQNSSEYKLRKVTGPPEEKTRANKNSTV